MAKWLFLVLTFTLSGCFNSLVLTPSNTGGPVQETVVTDADSCFCCNKIALIDVEGLIANVRSSGLLGGGDNPVTLFKERLEVAACDKRVKAIVLRINS